jgi:hypothetical protein
MGARQAGSQAGSQRLEPESGTVPGGCGTGSLGEHWLQSSAIPSRLCPGSETRRGRNEREDAG